MEALPQLRVWIKNPSLHGLPGSAIDGFHDMSVYVDYGGSTNQLQITEAWGRQGDTANVPLVQEHPPTKLIFSIEAMAEIKIINDPHGTNTTPTPANLSDYLFAGIITNPEFFWESPTLCSYYLQCADYTLYATTAIINTSYSGISLDNAMVDLVNSVSDQTGIHAALVGNHTAQGFPGQVQPAPVTPFIALPFMTLTQAIGAITKEASQSSKYGWIIDPNKELHFFNQFQAPAPHLLLTDRLSYGFPTLAHPGGPPGNGNPCQYLGHVEQGSQLYYELDGTQLYNEIQVMGAAITQPMELQGPPVQVWLGDGYTTSFALSEPILTQDTAATYIGVQALLLVNGLPVEVGLKSAEAGNVTTPWIFEQSNAGQWYLTSQVGPPPAGSGILVWYSYQIPLLMNAQDPISIGLYHHKFTELVNDNQLITEMQASARAQADLIEFSRVEERLNCYTTEDMIGNINAGDTVSVDLQSIPDPTLAVAGDNNGIAPLGVSDVFLVTSCTISILDTGRRQYQLQCLRISTS